MDIGFALKKFISFFLEPLGGVLLLLTLALYFLFTKRESLAKLLLFFGIFSLFLLSYPPFSNFLVKNLENQYPKYNYATSVKYIHVLGSGHNTDTTQPISSKLSDAGTKRVLEGVILYKKIPGSKLIFTGYKGKTKIANAVMNAKLAQALGVKHSDIIINKEAKDTKEEALFSKTLLNDSPFLLVTSATHMPRAMFLFHSLGMYPIAAPTDFYKEEFKGYLQAPEGRYFENSSKAIHEYIGILWAKIL